MDENIKSSGSGVVGSVNDMDKITPEATIGEVQNSIDLEINEQFKHLGLTPEDTEHARGLASNLTIDQAREIVASYVSEHKNDMLIPKEIVDSAESLVVRVDAASEKVDEVLSLELRMTAAIISRDSVYREIRAVYSPDDDENIPCGTIRAWVLGLIWACGLAALNQFFAPRQPSITITVYLAQMFVYPMGVFLAKTLPTRMFLQGSKFEFSLNPGPFSEKEHMLITIMANVTVTTPQVIELIFVQKLPIFFGQEWAGSWGYQLCMVLSTQFLGYSLAGICRRYLVYPPQMIWYYTLSQGALNKALHNTGNYTANGWKISRFNFFFVAFGAMFCYYWLPNTVFPTLTFFNWITWIKPQSAVTAIVTGSYYFNLGFNPLSSFDWNWFALLDPLYMPWFIVLQIVAAIFLWGSCVIIPTFFSNVWWTSYIPINSFEAYDNTGSTYNISRVLDENLKLVPENYRNYSPVFLSAAQTLRYACEFATIPAIFVFVGLWYGKGIWRIFKITWKEKGAFSAQNDIHSRQMSKYKEVPEWVFVLIGVIAAALGFASLYAWPTNTTGWVIPIGFLMSAVLIIPIGMVVAITAYELSLDIVFTIVGGYLFLGNPVGYMIFKVIGNAVTVQAVTFTADMKLGHYCKVPPRQMVAAQVVATFLASFIILGISHFQMGIENICDTSVQVRWICSGSQTLFSSSLQWSLVGSKRLFSAQGGMYTKLLWGFFGGIFWPLPWYFARKKWPRSVLRYCHPIVMMMGGVLWAPVNFSEVWQALPFAWFFGSYIKSRYLAWWSKYAYVLSSALTAGIAFSALIQFVALENNNISMPNWWGTTRYATTCDFELCPYMAVSGNETFGPATWE
ncbi:hypothetical protein BP5796_11263 [Coleophoma crateriformis]|uniref:Uncharacterized protein n=1 Tax=Coleophoma crateriformis TaxID=565419 RepID=A0A3D8QI25_9HELO|nr:hypothetical protein BP5796_11263 [Coleophoma crateriformis]